MLLNWFRAKCQFSSGVVEGFNNKAKLTARKAYGFRTYRAAAIALYHALGNLPALKAAHKFFCESFSKNIKHQSCHLYIIFSLQQHDSRDIAVLYYSCHCLKIFAFYLIKSSLQTSSLTFLILKFFANCIVRLLIKFALALGPSIQKSCH